MGRFNRLKVEQWLPRCVSCCGSDHASQGLDGEDDGIGSTTRSNLLKRETCSPAMCSRP